MNNKLLFSRKCSPQKTIQRFIHKYKLNFSYKDKDECIYENDLFMISVTKHLLFILIFEKDNLELCNEIKKFFYGE